HRILPFDAQRHQSSTKLLLHRIDVFLKKGHAVSKVWPILSVGPFPLTRDGIPAFRKKSRQQVVIFNEGPNEVAGTEDRYCFSATAVSDVDSGDVSQPAQLAT